MTVEDQFLSPIQNNPRGLAYDGAFLYLTYFAQADSGKVYKVDPVTRQLIQTFQLNLGYLGSLAYDCNDGTFWAGGYNFLDNNVVYHFNAAWQLIGSFNAPQVETALGGIDGLTVVGPNLYVGGDLATRVHIYTKGGAYLGPAIQYGYRRSGLAWNGTSSWAFFADVGFLTNSMVVGGAWQGFYTDFYYNYKDLDPSRPATGFIEDMEFACADSRFMWAHALQYDPNRTWIVLYDTEALAPSPLTPISSCSATDNSSANVTLTWTNVANEDGYRIFRNGAQIGSAGVDATSFIDTPSPDTYTYCVEAFNTSGSSRQCCDSGTLVGIPSPCAAPARADATARSAVAGGEIPGKAQWVRANLQASRTPKQKESIPLGNRPGVWQERSGGNYQGTLSGTLIKQSQATTTWFLYPGACTERQSGTWVPRTFPQADSLNSYCVGSTEPYGVADQSLSEILWHQNDKPPCTPGTSCPPALNGARSLWCGKFDNNWAVKYGYPNLSYQILYIDTGVHPDPGPATYNLVFNYNFSIEFNYDYVYLIGNHDNVRDPFGNSRALIDNHISNGTYLIRWTGSITPTTPNATGGNTATPVEVADNPGAPATVTGASYTIERSNRGLYFVFKSDCLFSSEDGLWPEGNGQLIDNLSASDTGAIFTDEVAPLDPITSGPLADTSVPPGGGIVLKGTASTPIISARVAPGIGTLWQLVRGSNLPTPDVCTPKNSTSDLIFEGGNAATFHTVPNQFNSVVTCSFPVPAGVASVLALWDEYLDLPRFQGYVQYAEFRIHKDGNWGNWENTSPGGGVTTGARQSWGLDGDELGAATQADSVQIRYNIQCINFFAADHLNCGDVTYGVLYDNFRLELVTGVPAPIFGVFVGSVAQTMFVDGTMGGGSPPTSGCLPATVATGQCWPGVRGSDISGSGEALRSAVHDNFNSPLGDSITLAVVTGLRKSGKGVNWHFGFDKAVNFGLSIAHTNPNYVAAHGAPRVIYRLFDPATKAWSPFDSSEIDADGIQVSGGDTTLIDSEYRINWPPRDKVGTSLPGGFSINGKTLYSQLAFLPRGTRMQYYFKGVDLNGGTSWQFSTDALAREDASNLPFLPCQTGDPGCVSGGAQPGNHNSIVAPDVIQFEVLPGVYSTANSAGTLVAGRTNTPLLDLDGSYTRWNFQTHATTQALKYLGVRADRLRILQGLEEGAHIGGHEFAGTRAGRLSNYFPNQEEYGIVDSLRLWYRIMIESSHTSTVAVDEESDSRTIRDWWRGSTGTDGGDRCLFASGDDYFSALLAVGGVPHPHENALASQVFGVAAAANQWNGGGSIVHPFITDLFANPASGPALTSGYRYVVDGGCPAPNRFDALTKTADAAVAATYPTFATVTNTAGVSRMVEDEIGVPIGTADHDRNKALAYGFSIQFIRQGGENFVDQRAQVLYKFLTSCRGPRAVTDTASCWPCPTDANKYGNWAVLAGFNTGTYGPLYAIQNGNLAGAPAGVETPGAEAPRFFNALSQNRPNPFNPETIIPYSLAAKGRVTVRIYDISGRCIRTLVDAVKDAGIHQARWTGELDSGGRAASSIYFYRITYADGTSSAKKMAILR